MYIYIYIRIYVYSYIYIYTDICDLIDLLYMPTYMVASIHCEETNTDLTTLLLTPPYKP